MFHKTDVRAVKHVGKLRAAQELGSSGVVGCDDTSGRLSSF